MRFNACAYDVIHSPVRPYYRFPHYRRSFAQSHIWFSGLRQVILGFVGAYLRGGPSNASHSLCVLSP